DFTVFDLEAYSERGNPTSSFTTGEDITVTADVLASVTGEGDARAHGYLTLVDMCADAGAGDQGGQGVGEDIFTNDGTIALTMNVTAESSGGEAGEPAGGAYAYGEAIGVHQSAYGSHANFTNNDSYALELNVTADGEDWGEA